MSASCVGTCTNCGAQRFWPSDTKSLQTDDGRLKCLPHPGEGSFCELEGLTLGQASARGRLYRETFFVCRNCGRDGQTIERAVAVDRDPLTWSIRWAFKWGWGAAAVVIPVLVWMRWWEATAAIGGTLLASPAIARRENRKAARALAARGLPRADAPGRSPIPEPTAGCRPEMVVGRPLPAGPREWAATGPCCDRPDWVEAYRVRDADRVPCAACGRGVMVVSEQSIH